MSKKKYFLALLVLLLVVFGGFITIWTKAKLLPFDDELTYLADRSKKPIFLDRYGKRLNTTYANHWNLYDKVALYDVPKLLQYAIITSEDKRFFTHNGIDWLARLSAAWQNVSSLKVVRGASTISEQVVRMIHPRRRSMRSRWIEGFESMELERRYSKLDILEFYLNQVPYQGQRRGIVQAAHYYFDRDLSTLNEREILALVVLIRSPRWFDPYKQLSNLNHSITDLLDRIEKKGYIDTQTYGQIKSQTLDIKRPNLTVNAQHFIAFASKKLDNKATSTVYTTLDASLQVSVQKILNTHIDQLSAKNINNGAVLVIDHHTNEILSWVVAYAGEKNRAFNAIDPIITKRQPGSALKPFLYAKALQKGWNAATLIDDSPLQESVGLGLHTYHNYSKSHYGLISMREALGNSLNIPAIKTLQYIGAEDFLHFLHDFGIKSLTFHPNVYGDGIALGNGELTLYELTRAYSALARMGDFKELNFIEGVKEPTKRVLSEDIASLIADILSDPQARQKEFGYNSILNLPYQTAVKTGTSSDYRDAWAIGYNDRYSVGVWFGNLDYRPMSKVTGSSGPAYVLRTVFNELNKNRQIKALYLSPRLQKKRVCNNQESLDSDKCQTRDELFLADFKHNPPTKKKEQNIRLRKPTNGLLLATDPRIPDDDEYFSFELNDIKNLQKVKWYINGKYIAESTSKTYPWRVQKGIFRVKAEVWIEAGKEGVVTKEVEFRVQ